jgi:hypothetical protein
VAIRDTSQTETIRIQAAIRRWASKLDKSPVPRSLPASCWAELSVQAGGGRFDPIAGITNFYPNLVKVDNRCF